MSMPLSAVYGPHDDDLPLQKWFEITLACIAEDEQELDRWKMLMRTLRQQYACVDVGSLKELSRTQLEAAATTAIGQNAAKGTVRLVCKYLGPMGNPHVPPMIVGLDEPQWSSASAKEKQVAFGRIGKTGKDSAESNFPEAMMPSSQTPLDGAIKFPTRLKSYLKDVAAKYNDHHPLMTQNVTMEVTEEVTDWIVSMYGTSPVRVLTRNTPQAICEHIRR